jgi:hypothetical protein
MPLRTVGLGLMLSVAWVVPAQEGPEYTTIQLRDGTRLTGRLEALGNGALILRISLADQRRIPASDIAVIDRRNGGTGVADGDLREARRPSHLLLLADGATVSGRLMAIQQVTYGGSDRSLTYVFRTFDGRERRYQEAEVARAYLGSYGRPATLSNAKTNAAKTNENTPSRSGSGTETGVVALR